MQDLVDQLNGLKLPVPMTAAYLLYGAAVLAVFVYTVRWWRRTRAEGSGDRVAIVLVTLAVYALVMPRMKDYSYVALLPVAWYALWLPMITQVYVYAPLVGALAVWMAIIGDRPTRRARELDASPAQIAA